MASIKSVIADPKNYSKFWVSLTAPLGVLVYVLAPAEGELAFVLTRNEAYLVFAALAASIGVYAVPNKSSK